LQVLDQKHKKAKTQTQHIDIKLIIIHIYLLQNAFFRKKTPDI